MRNRVTPDATTGRRPEPARRGLLRDLRRRSRAGDVAAKWLLRLLTRGEAAPPASPRRGHDCPPA
jgi:hypothetical protein